MIDKNNTLDEHDDQDDDFEVIELEEGHDEDEDENDGDDDRLESDQREAQDEGVDGEEVNARQLRRKRQKQRQRENMKKTREENAHLLRELLEAKERLAALESRNIQTDAQTADQRYQFAMAQIAKAEAELKMAFETGDGDKAIQAQRLREQSIQAAREAEDLKKRLTNPQLQQKSSVLDPRTESFAQQWISKNPWFNPSGTDEDSVIARAIDEAWASEAQRKGISPSSEAYWDELDARVKRRLGTASSERERKRSAPPVTGRGDAARPSTGDKQMYLTPERKKALQDAGVWDDPEKRKRYIQRFREYDRQNQR
jgi:hypothetical protein